MENLAFAPLFFFVCLFFSIYIFPLSRLSLSVFNGSQGCLNKESVKNLLYMTSAHHNRRQLRLPAAQPREKMSTWPAKPRKFYKNNSQIRALLWHAFLRSAFVSRPCNCRLYDWLMQTWQVQNTALKPKYWLLMLLGIRLEYKTAHCTLKMARIGIRRTRSCWHMVNTAFSVLFLRNVMSALPWITTLVITIVLTVVVSYGMTYPVFFFFCFCDPVPH